MDTFFLGDGFDLGQISSSSPRIQLIMSYIIPFLNNFVITVRVPTSTRNKIPSCVSQFFSHFYHKTGTNVWDLFQANNKHIESSLIFMHLDCVVVTFGVVQRWLHKWEPRRRRLETANKQNGVNVINLQHEGQLDFYSSPFQRFQKSIESRNKHNCSIPISVAEQGCVKLRSISLSSPPKREMSSKQVHIQGTTGLFSTYMHHCMHINSISFWQQNAPVITLISCGQRWVGENSAGWFGGEWNETDGMERSSISENKRVPFVCLTLLGRPSRHHQTFAQMLNHRTHNNNNHRHHTNPKSLSFSLLLLSSARDKLQTGRTTASPPRPNSVHHIILFMQIGSVFHF